MLPARAARWLESALSLLVVLVPFCLAVWRATGAAQWRADLAMVRDRGLAAVGVGGTLSTVLHQALGLVPLGNHAFRAAVGSALALSLAAALLYRIAQLVLGTTEGAVPVGRPLRSLLAAMAVLAATLSPTWQQEATVAGGATVGAAAALGSVLLALRLNGREGGALTPSFSTRWLLVAILAAASLGESVPAGVAALGVSFVAVLLSHKRPRSQLLQWMALSFLVVLLALWAPLALRSHAPNSLADVGRALSATSLEPLRTVASRTTAVQAWLAELGYVSLLLAALGAAAGCWRRASRLALCPLVVLVVVDLLFPVAVAGGIGPDRMIALRLLAIGALAVSSALGVTLLVGFLVGLQVPMARTASVLAVVFYASVVALTCEEAGFQSDRSGDFATEVWTDDALGTLPPRAALLVHSPDLAWRLWSARIDRVERPDVLVVPAPLIHDADLMASLLPAEGEIAPLLRDFALQGQASEFALSALADARPLYVELAADWDERLVDHLSVEGHWLRYAPEPLGRTDREPEKQDVWREGGPLAEALAATTARDDLTEHVVARTLKEHAAALSLVGLRSEARRQVERLEQLSPSDPFVTGARLRLAYAEQVRARNVELRDLLRF